MPSTSPLANIPLLEEVEKVEKEVQDIEEEQERVKQEMHTINCSRPKRNRQREGATSLKSSPSESQMVPLEVEKFHSLDLLLSELDQKIISVTMEKGISQKLQTVRACLASNRSSLVEGLDVANENMRHLMDKFIPKTASQPASAFCQHSASIQQPVSIQQTAARSQAASQQPASSKSTTSQEPVNHEPAVSPQPKGKGKGKAPPLGTPTVRQPSRFYKLRWIPAKATACDKLDSLPPVFEPMLMSLQTHKKHDLHQSGVVPVGQSCFSGLAKDDMGDEPSELLLSKLFSRGNTMARTSLEPTQVNPNAFLNEKEAHILGVILKTHCRHHKEEESDAVLTIKQSLLKCDFQILRVETLVGIRTVVKDKFFRPLLDPSSLDIRNLLTYELLKVPQIKVRLDCMMFKVDFPGDLAKVKKNVDMMSSALRMLKSKQQLIGTFFCLTLRLLRSVNGETSKPKHGFKLKTLEMLMKKPCTKKSEWTMFDFVLALMPSQDANDFFSDMDVALLQDAKNKTAYKVYEDGCELVHKLADLKHICDTGNYIESPAQKPVKMERRRLTMTSRTPNAEARVDHNDRFHQDMKEFVEENLPAVRSVQKDCAKFMLLYKELAVFFEALNEVYPPPLNRQDDTFDLCDIFFSFAQYVRKKARNLETLRDFVRSPI